MKVTNNILRQLASQPQVFSEFEAMPDGSSICVFRYAVHQDGSTECNPTNKVRLVDCSCWRWASKIEKGPVLHRGGYDTRPIAKPV